MTALNIELLKKGAAYIQPRKRDKNRFVLRKLTGWGTYEAIIDNKATGQVRRCTMQQSDINALAAWLDKCRDDISKTSIPTDAQVDRWIETKREQLKKEKQL